VRPDGDDVAFDVAVRHGLDERELAAVFGISRGEVRVRRLRAVADVSLACLTPFRDAPAWLRERTLDRLDER
jgi:transposase